MSTGWRVTAALGEPVSGSSTVIVAGCALLVIVGYRIVAVWHFRWLIA
jgi:hypothetical protein